MTAQVSEFLPFLGASAFAYMAYIVGTFLSRRMSKAAVRRMENFSGKGSADQAVASVEFGSHNHKLRLAFAQFGVNVAGWEAGALWLGRGLAGLGVFLAMYALVGLPIGPSLIGFLGGLLLMSGIMDGAWSKVRVDMEAEIPAFLNGFSSTIQVTQDVLRAIEEEAGALDPKGPLRAWLLNFVSEAQSKGHDALEAKVKEAFSISSALGVVLFLIGRFWTTGGQEWAKSFALASTNLEGVLDARILARATGEGGKGSVKVVAGVTVVVIVMMVRNPALSSTMQDPLVQLVYAGIALAMVFGWAFMNNLIDNLI
jgi:hypothetical protein